MSSLQIIALPFLFIFLVFIALTYDKTVTPTINWFNKFKKIKRGNSNVSKTFKLYDEAIFIALIGLSFFTYRLVVSESPIYLSYPSIFFVAWLWILILFKIYRIEILKDNIVRFRCAFRNIDLKASDITEIQDWLRFVRVKYDKGSLILFPFVDKLGDFKFEIKSINSDAKINDVANNFFDSKWRVILLMLAIFTYFIALIYYYFWKFTYLN